MAKKKNNVDILKVVKKAKKDEKLSQNNVRQALDDYSKTIGTQNKRLSTRKKVIIAVSALTGVAALSTVALISLKDKTNYIYPYIDYNLTTLKDDTIQMVEGNTIADLKVKEISGYRFDGWYSDANFTTKFNNEDLLQNKLTIYARYIKIDNIAITINNYTHNIKYDEGLTLNEILENNSLDITDYNSCGWFTDADLTTPYNGELVDNIHIFTKTATLNKLEFETIENSSDYKAILNEQTNPNGVGNIVVPKAYNQGNVVDFGFQNCIVSNISIPSTITKFSDFALYNSTLGSINFTNNITEIGNNAFEQTSIVELSLPKTITEIGTEAFKGCSLTKIDFNGIKITSIKNGTFENCANLKIVDLQNCNNLERIELNSFANCSSLEKIVIPKSTTIIDNNVFNHCPNLSTIVISAENEVYDSRNNCNAIIDSNSNTLLFGCKGTVIPESVLALEENSFADCIGLESIIIPNGVVSIAKKAFEGCVNLTTVTIADSVTNISECVFKNCYKLANVSLSKHISTLPTELFANCHSLNTISIPENVNTITERVFLSSGLNSLHLPKSVTQFAPSAIEQCVNLKTITVDELNSTYDSRDACNAIINTAENTLIAGCSNTLIPYSIHTIGETAFKNCVSLDGITITSNITTIESEAFAGCLGLTKIDLPIEVKKIGANAFKDCKNLTSFYIPTKTTQIVYVAGADGNMYATTVTKDSAGLWYKVQSLTDWQNNTNGTHCDVSDTNKNAQWFTSMSDFVDYYWYKLEKTD